MEKIPTAEEVFKEIRNSLNGSDNKIAVYAMREFAKLHVKAALRAAIKSAGYYKDTSMGFAINPETILNSYPDEKIL